MDSTKLGDDLKISSVSGKFQNGTWVCGSVAGYEFSAFLDAPGTLKLHGGYQGTRITKLSVDDGRSSTRVFAWDNREYVAAKNEEARAVADYIARGLKAYGRLIREFDFSMPLRSISREEKRRQISMTDLVSGPGKAAREDYAKWYSDVGRQWEDALKRY